MKHLIYLVLNAKFNKENVLCVLLRIAKDGYSVFEIEPYDQLNVKENRPLSIDQAVNYIMEKTTQNQQQKAAIVIRINQKNLILSFCTDQYNSFDLYLSLLENDGKQEFSNKEIQKDSDRYIRFLLDITQDFPIFNIGIKYQ